MVGRSAIVRELDTRGLFLGITEPMPVGTPVILKIGEDSVPGKVAAVSESQELARAGEVYDLVQSEIEQVNRDLAADPRMAGAQIRRFLILHKALEADDGELTRTNKVRRGFIGERYKSLIDALYDGSRTTHIKVDVTFEDGRKGSIEGDVEIRDLAPHMTAVAARPLRKAS